MEFFLKYKVILLRTAGVLLLVVGFALNFWTTPKEGLTQIEIAAANVARMEAGVAGSSGSTKKSEQPKVDLMQEFKNQQEKQMKFLTIIAMIIGAIFLGFSFIKKEKPSA